MNYSFLVSVYAKESAAFCAQAIHSMQSQTHEPSEIVVVEDGPLPEELVATLERVQAGDARIRTVRLPRNLGLGHALAAGLDECRFDVVARMDADDICRSDRLEQQIAVLEGVRDLAVVGSNIEEFDKSPGDLNRHRIVPTMHDDIKAMARRRNPMNHMTVVFRRSAVQKVGSYRPALGYEDYYLWVRMLARHYRFHNIDDCLVFARTGNGLVSRRRGVEMARRELAFQVRLFREGLIGAGDCAVNVLSRVPIRLMPAWAVGRVYRHGLRRKRAVAQ